MEKTNILVVDMAFKYLEDVVNGKEVVNHDVLLQCNNFLKDFTTNQQKEDFEFYFDFEKLKVINNLLALFYFAKGLLQGMPVLPYLSGYQALLIVAIFGWRYKDNPKKFRYRDVILYIARKNSKTYTVAYIFLLLLLTEDDYSEFYSICVNKDLAAEVKKAMQQTIECSPAIRKHFVVSKSKLGRITCKLTKSFYEPRASEAFGNNAINPSAFVSDEHAGFTEKSNYNAMRSGQKSVRNPITFITTTGYPESNSIMNEEIEYAEAVLNGVIQNQRYFALLYFAEEKHLWDDIGLMQANPLRIEENYQEIRDHRVTCKFKQSEETEYLTKEMNVLIDTVNEDENYLDMKSFRKCKVDKIDFSGRKVVVSVDLSKSIDLTAVGMMYRDINYYYYKVHGFLPRVGIERRKEKIDYYYMERKGYCTIQEGRNIKYKQIADYIKTIEPTYNCKIKCIAIDPTYADVLVEELEEFYDIVVLRQTYTVLSPPTLSMRDAIYEGRFFYEENELFEWNMSNATVSEGKAGDIMLNKTRKSNNTRIDMAVVAPFAYSQLYLEECDYDAVDALLSQDWGD